MPPARNCWATARALEPALNVRKPNPIQRRIASRRLSDPTASDEIMLDKQAQLLARFGRQRGGGCDEGVFQRARAGACTRKRQLADQLTDDRLRLSSVPAQLLNDHLDCHRSNRALPQPCTGDPAIRTG